MAPLPLQWHPLRFEEGHPTFEEAIEGHPHWVALYGIYGHLRSGGLSGSERRSPRGAISRRPPTACPGASPPEDVRKRRRIRGAARRRRLDNREAVYEPDFTGSASTSRAIATASGLGGEPR